MQFLVTALDGMDEKALQRRMKVREVHLKRAEQMYKDGTMLYACAILDEAGKMIGSVLMVEFPSEQSLREDWLATEPYVTGDVWQDITIQPCRVPGFIKP